MSDEAIKALDHATNAFLIGDSSTMVKCLFVWSQRRDHILAGEETWDDQRVEEPVWGGQRDQGQTDRD